MGGLLSSLTTTPESMRRCGGIGEPSGGDNGSLNRGNLPGGWTVSWSGQRTLKHDGSPWHGVGAKPTVRASRTVSGIAAGRDEVVERAVEVVAAPRQP